RLLPLDRHLADLAGREELHLEPGVVLAPPAGPPRGVLAVDGATGGQVQQQVALGRAGRGDRVAGQVRSRSEVRRGAPRPQVRLRAGGEVVDDGLTGEDAQALDPVRDEAVVGDALGVVVPRALARHLAVEHRAVTTRERVRDLPRRRGRGRRATEAVHVGAVAVRDAVLVPQRLRL